ncbi:hypothetical protein L2E82_19783 [Cichorium intybus]|uniref:Uncharacterized protein n=1 Tax=Cichorium intybus TaxID=13427 RepID=A0ACB9DRT9_CICIN|nr:hypothetical protein L2E82_19783 [Cichorium intybus]
MGRLRNEFGESVFCFCVSISRRSTASLSLSVEVLKTSTARIVPPRITPNLSRDFPCPPKEVDAEYRVLSKDFPIMKTFLFLRARNNVLLPVPAVLYAINNYLKFTMQLYFNPATVALAPPERIQSSHRLLVTVPFMASVFNSEYALKSQYDTSIYLQNLTQWGGALLELSQFGDINESKKKIKGPRIAKTGSLQLHVVRCDTIITKITWFLNLERGNRSTTSPRSFESIEEYLRVFQPLLFEECRAELYSTWEELTETSSKNSHTMVCM